MKRSVCAGTEIVVRAVGVSGAAGSRQCVFHYHAADGGAAAHPPGAGLRPHTTGGRVTQQGDRTRRGHLVHWVYSDTKKAAYTAFFLYCQSYLPFGAQVCQNAPIFIHVGRFQRNDALHYGDGAAPVVGI